MPALQRSEAHRRPAPSPTRRAPRPLDWVGRDVSRTRPPARLPTAWLVTAAVGIAAGALLLSVARTQITGMRLELGAEQALQAELLKRVQSLRVEVESLRHPARLRAEAEALGLAPAPRIPVWPSVAVAGESAP